MLQCSNASSGFPISLISVRLKMVMNMKASGPGRAGGRPFAVSLRMSVSRPIAAKCNREREQECRHRNDPGLGLRGNLDQGVGADSLHFFFVERAANALSAMTIGAKSLTRDILAMVTNSPAFPFWKVAAIT
jgi:hypothetical protein